MITWIVLKNSIKRNYQLKNRCIAFGEYDHAGKVKVWKTFEIKTICEYHDLHLKSDVL